MVYTIYYFLFAILLFVYLFLIYKFRKIEIIDYIIIFMIFCNMYLPIYKLNNIKNYYGKLLIENNITVNKYKKDYNDIKVDLYKQKLKGE